MGKAPAFQFYAADFLIGVGEFSFEERGLYITLLSFSWDKGPLPLDPLRLARLVGTTADDFDRLWVAVGEKWKRTKSGWINERLEEQRAQRDAYVAKQAEKGRRSGDSRRTTVEPRLNHGSVPVRTEDEPNTNSSTSSSTSVHPSDKERPQGVSPHAKPTNLINGKQQLNHGSHAWCSLPREGLCVPTHAFHVELMGRAVKSEAEIKAIYRQVVDRHDGVPMTGDIFAFWRKEVDAVAGAKPQTALYDPDAGRRTREEMARKRAMGAAQ